MRSHSISLPETCILISKFPGKLSEYYICFYNVGTAGKNNKNNGKNNSESAELDIGITGGLFQRFREISTHFGDSPDSLNGLGIPGNIWFRGFAATFTC